MANHFRIKKEAPQYFTQNRLANVCLQGDVFVRNINPISQYPKISQSIPSSKSCLLWHL
jgi:hypothetical protein